MRWGDTTYAGKTALIVSDQTFSRQVVGQALGRLGFAEVHKAGSAQKGIGLCRASPPDLIVVDAEMQPQDGYAFLQAYRQAGDLKNRPVAVIFLSASNDVEDVRRAIGLGAAGYLVKPVSFRAIKEHVGKVMGRGVAA